MLMSLCNTNVRRVNVNRTNANRIVAVGLFALTIVAVVGCSEGPTAVPARAAKDALAPYQTCYLIEGHIYCTTADTATARLSAPR
jgi:hypothetical protein